MRARRRWRWIIAGVPVLAFGLGCLNYTAHDGWGHHTEVAAQHGWPPPSADIQRLGMALTAFGGLVTGFGFSRRSA